MAYRKRSNGRRRSSYSSRSARRGVRSGSGRRRISFRGRRGRMSAGRTNTVRLVIESHPTSPAMRVPESLGGGFAVQGEAPKKNPTF